MIRPRFKPDFLEVIARTGLSITEFAARANVTRGTIYRGMYPEQYPNYSGKLHRSTAWKLAKAYAEITAMDESAAYALLFMDSDQ